MKGLLLAIIAFGGAMTSFAQTDSTTTTTSEKVDTIRVGGMVIIKRTDKNKSGKGQSTVEVNTIKKNKKSNLSTNWWIVDLGFANYSDKTNYGSAEAQAFAPGVGSKEGLELRTGKSVNVNIWFFMQRLNLVKHVLNLKYGLGLELNNYRFDDVRVLLTENPTTVSINNSFSALDKNKLAADFVTVPMMLNFNFTPDRKKGFGFSAGMSAGYLYSARQKIKDGDDKNKTHDDFDLNRFKLSYIGELNLGPILLYGSLGMKSMWEKGLDQTPYNVGIRLSNW
jgi:hypothetical protein